MPNSTIAITAGSGTLTDSYLTTTGHRVNLIDSPYEATYRNTSYRMVGKNGTAQAPSINPTVRTYAVLDMVDATNTLGLYITSVVVDMFQGEVYTGVTAQMPIRLIRGLSTDRTGGDTMTRVVEKDDVAGAYALGQFYCDASADGVSSTTALVHTGTISAGTEQTFASQNYATTGYEVSDSIEFASASDPILLTNGQSLAVINSSATGKDFSTFSWIVSMRWGVNKL